MFHFQDASQKLLLKSFLKAALDEPVDVNEIWDTIIEIEQIEDAAEQEKPYFEEYLKETGLTPDDAIHLMHEFQADFRNRAERYGMSLEDHPALVRRLCELAEKEPSKELLRFYCELLCCSELFFSTDEEDSSELADAADYMESREYVEQLYDYFCKRIELSSRFCSITQTKLPKEIPAASRNPDRKHQVFQTYAKLLGSKDSQQEGLFLDNIEYLLRMVDGMPTLRPVTPLFLYQMLIRHGKRLHTSDSTTFNLSALWKYRGYNIDEDNEKNWGKHSTYIRLFAEICKLYRDDPEIDLALCGFGFDQLSNLGDFYRDGALFVELYDDVRLEELEDLCEEEYNGKNPLVQMAGIKLRLPESLDNILLKTSCSCWEGLDENILLKECGISEDELLYFLSDTKKKRTRILDNISEYVSQHANQLLEDYCQFNYLDGDAVRAFCGQVLRSVPFSGRNHPKLSDIPMYLAGINSVMIDLLRKQDQEYLKCAGLLLLGSRA